MKKISTFFISVIAMTIFSLPASAASESDFLYAVKEDGTAIITEFVGYEENLVIPAEIDGYSVSEIGTYCFEHESGLRTLEVPSSVQIIAEKAFADCYGLETVKLSEGLREIKGYAFSGCSYLGEIVIPESVNELGGGAFKGCSYLRKAVIGNGVTVINEDAFGGCYVLEEVSLGSKVVTIKENAFEGAVLPTIFIPASVQRIEPYAFDNAGIIDVYYGGTEAQWEEIDISYGNAPLKNGKIRFMVDAQGKMDKTAIKKTMGITLIYVCVVAALLVAVILVLVKTRKRDVCPYCNSGIDNESVYCGNCGSKL